MNEPCAVVKTESGLASRGGRVEVTCTFCGDKFQRYRSETFNKEGQLRKVFRCKKCRRIPPEIRFWKYVDKTSSAKGCWLWTGALNADGYPHFPWPEKGLWRGNIISWVLNGGIIPDGMYVLHKQFCHDRKCVNPDHLYIGDQFDNMHDAVVQGTHFSGPGEKNPNAKLTDAIVRQIREDAKSMPIKEIAFNRNLKEGTIRDVINRSWKHVK